MSTEKMVVTRYGAFLEEDISVDLSPRKNTKVWAAVNTAINAKSPGGVDRQFLGRSNIKDTCFVVPEHIYPGMSITFCAKEQRSGRVKRDDRMHVVIVNVQQVKSENNANVTEKRITWVEFPDEVAALENAITAVNLWRSGHGKETVEDKRVPTFCPYCGKGAISTQTHVYVEEGFYIEEESSYEKEGPAPKYRCGSCGATFAAWFSDLDIHDPDDYAEPTDKVLPTTQLVRAWVTADGHLRLSLTKEGWCMRNELGLVHHDTPGDLRKLDYGYNLMLKLFVDKDNDWEVGYGHIPWCAYQFDDGTKLFWTTSVVGDEEPLRFLLKDESRTVILPSIEPADIFCNAGER